MGDDSVVLRTSAAASVVMVGGGKSIILEPLGRLLQHLRPRPRLLASAVLAVQLVYCLSLLLPARFVGAIVISFTHEVMGTDDR